MIQWDRAIEKQAFRGRGVEGDDAGRHVFDRRGWVDERRTDGAGIVARGLAHVVQQDAVDAEPHFGVGFERTIERGDGGGAQADFAAFKIEGQRGGWAEVDQLGDVDVLIHLPRAGRGEVGVIDDAGEALFAVGSLQ